MGKKYNSEQTVENIISIAYKLFTDKGYDKTSMIDIISELGMSKGAVFHHFKSKEDIFKAVVISTANEQMAKLKAFVENELSHLNGRDKITTLLRSTQNANSNHVAEVMLSKITDPKVIMGMLEYNIKMSAPILANILKEGIADGSITTEYPEQCAEVIMVLANFWADPMILKCDWDTYLRRLKYYQWMLKTTGVDIITDEFINENVAFSKELYDIQETKGFDK